MKFVDFKVGQILSSSGNPYFNYELAQIEGFVLVLNPIPIHEAFLDFEETAQYSKDYDLFSLVGK